MKDKAAKAAYDKARRARLYVDKRPTVCRRDGCENPVVQARTSVRYFCSDRCKGRQFYAEHPGYGYVPAAPVEPMPMPYVGHEVFEQAAKAARLTGAAYSVDWGQNDIMGEAVLAILEGRDPREAVYWHRKWERDVASHRVYAHDIGWDGKNVVVQRYGEEES